MSFGVRAPACALGRRGITSVQWVVASGASAASPVNRHETQDDSGRLWHIRHLADYAALAALQDVSPHSFRRTVATEIDEVYDAEAAMNQLGHTSKVVTERHYINRRLVVPDYRAATDRLAPGPETSDGPTPGP